MISAEEFARAYRQESAEESTPLPAVILEYEAGTEIATVVPLIKQIYRDGTTEDLPQIHGVPIVTPRTAYSGLKLPVKAGDKVTLIFTMRSLDELLESDLSGLDIPDQIDPLDNKLKDYSFCIGYVGFNDENSAIGTDDSVHLLNNWQKTQENRLRLEGNGDCLLSNDVASAKLEIDGTITVKNAAGSIVMSPSGQLTILAPGNMNVTAPTTTFTSSTVNVTGNLNVGGNAVVTGTAAAAQVTATNTGTVLGTHEHPGDGNGPGNTGPPI